MFTFFPLSSPCVSPYSSVRDAALAKYFCQLDGEAAKTDMKDSRNSP